MMALAMTRFLLNPVQRRFLQPCHVHRAQIAVVCLIFLANPVFSQNSQRRVAVPPAAIPGILECIWF